MPYHASRQAACVKADVPVPADCPLWFFEMLVESGGEDDSVGERLFFAHA